jgi:hypothetical protein
LAQSSAPPLTLDDIQESGIHVKKNLWFEWLQDEGFADAPKPKKKQQQPDIFNTIT